MDAVDLFVAHVKSECKKHNIRLQLRKAAYLKFNGSSTCSGYFDSGERLLAVATNRVDWLSILVHEYAHLTQWVDNCEAWRLGSNSLTKAFGWLEGDDVRNYRFHLGRVRDLELDNEKRSVKLIKKWQLPIDVKEYTQKANAYVLYYNWMCYTRRWMSTKTSPYSNPTIYAKMPTTFRTSYRVLCKKHRKLFETAEVQ